METDEAIDPMGVTHAPAAALDTLPEGSPPRISLSEGEALAAAEELPREHPGRYLADAEAEELGRGGVGRVLARLDLHLGRRVALKQLLAEAGEPGGSGSVGALERFLREARVTSQLEHPNIVPVYELGRRGDGSFYYTMKIIRGRTLSEVLAEREQVADRVALLEHFHDACQAVAYAHSRGVLHRDLKPQNIMVGEFGETVVVDWGLAKERGREELGEAEVEAPAANGPAATLAGSRIGTPAYMSPEQATGNVEAIDERSDVWALGAILYELLTGRAPFLAHNIFALLHRIDSEDVAPVLSVTPEAPPDLAAVAERALRRKPAERYQKVTDLIADIEAFQAGRQVGAYRYSARELIGRFVAEHRAASVAALAVFASVLIGTALVSRAYLREAEARVEADAAREDAERRHEEARASALVAQDRLTEAYLERAERVLEEGDPGAASIFAAAALLHDPRNPRNPGVAAEESRSPEERAHDQERIARAYSRYYEGFQRRSYRLDRILGPPLRLEGQVPAGLRVARPGSGLPAINDLTLEPGGGALLAALASGHLARWALDGRGRDPAPRIRRVEGLGGHLWLFPQPLPPGASPPGAGARVAALDRAGRALLLDAATLEPVRALPEAGAPLRALAWSPDGRRLAAAYEDGALRIFDAEGEASPRPEPISPGLALTGVGWLDPARVVVVAQDRRLRVWSPEGGARIVPAALGMHPIESDSLRVLAGGAVAVRTYDNRLSLYERGLLEEGSEEGSEGAVGGPRAWEHELTSAVPLRGGEVLACGGQGSVALRAASSGVALETLLGAGLYPRASGGSGRLATTDTSGGVRLWRRVRDGLLARSPSSDRLRFSLDGTPDGRLLVAAGAREILIYEISSGRPFEALEPRRLATPGIGMQVVAISADGRWLASRGRRTGRLYDLRGEDPPRALFDEEPIDVGFTSPAFSPDGRELFLPSRDGTIRRWQMESERWGPPLVGHESGVYSLAVSPDGATLASVSNDGTARLWDLRSDAPPVILERRTELLSGVAFSPSGDRLATSGRDGVARVWDLGTRALLAELRGHSEWINRVIFSPDGELLLTASDDKTARLWRASTGAPLQIFHLTSGALVARFTPDGRAFFLSEGPHLSRYRLRLPDLERDPRELLREAEEAVGMRLEGLSLVPIEAEAQAAPQ